MFKFLLYLLGFGRFFKDPVPGEKYILKTTENPFHIGCTCVVEAVKEGWVKYRFLDYDGKPMQFSRPQIQKKGLFLGIYKKYEDSPTISQS